ncbi:hypothetical protein MRX96_007208 [Rhipicephalus microplus]
MLTKPFVFVVQVVATIFGTEAAEYKSVLTDPSHGWKELHGIEIPLRGHRCLIEEAALSLVPTPTHAPTSVTSATSDLPTAIRSHVPPSNFSGPGSGTQGEMLTKPFVFVVQLRKLWDNDKSKWKKKQSEEKRSLYGTGGGQNTCRPMSPSLALVGAAASHMGTRLQNPYDSDGAHLNQPVLSLSPSRIFESMLTGSQDNTEELLDETIQPQLRSSKSAGSSGPQTTQPPTEGACASCPSHTLAVVAPGNEESRTAAAAPEDNRENLVGAGERQRPKSTRSRLAAIERVLAPEAAARMEALKTDKQRKAQLHALELRLQPHDNLERYVLCGDTESNSAVYTLT